MPLFGNYGALCHSVLPSFPQSLSTKRCQLPQLHKWRLKSPRIAPLVFYTILMRVFLGRVSVNKVILILLLAITSSNAFAKELTVIFGVSRPPFISQDPPSGISYELFNIIASRLGWQFQAKFASNKRMEHELSSMVVDVIVEVQKSNDLAYYSDPFLAYRNFAVSRAKDNIIFRDYADLKGRSVCSWQNASKNLGVTFENQIPNFKLYKEYPYQETQVRSWLSKECEVILIDDTLLKWWVNALEPSFHQRNRDIDIDLLFAPLPNNELWWYVAFHNEKLRDNFNLELQKIRSTKEYERIREQVSFNELR